MKEDRLAREKETLRAMVAVYCHDHHRPDKDLCDECEALLAYAEQRLAACPYGPDKPTCAHCPIHCYKTAMRERVREVMRYAGPRMLSRHPLLALRHLLDSRVKVPPQKNP